MFSATMIEQAALIYGDGSAEDIRKGYRVELLQGTDANDLLETLKVVAQRYLYPADRVQRPFLAGLRIVHGILDEYSKLLVLSRQDFALLHSAWRSANRGAVADRQLETLLPLFDNLPPHYLQVYESALEDSNSENSWGTENWEWFSRAHLIVDYLSGMTDDFAHRMYSVISGVRLD
jgi:dGTPase